MKSTVSLVCFQNLLYPLKDIIGFNEQLSLTQLATLTPQKILFGTQRTSNRSEEIMRCLYFFFFMMMMMMISV